MNRAVLGNEETTIVHDESNGDECYHVRVGYRLIPGFCHDVDLIKEIGREEMLSWLVPAEGPHLVKITIQVLNYSVF